MPTGVPANQLTDDEKRAVYRVVMAVFIDDAIPEGVNRGDLFLAFGKLTAQLNTSVVKKPKQKIKKGSSKEKSE